MRGKKEVKVEVEVEVRVEIEVEVEGASGMEMRRMQTCTLPSLLHLDALPVPVSHLPQFGPRKGRRYV